MLKRYDYTISVYCIREDRDEIMAMLKKRLARRVQPTTLRFHCVIHHITANEPVITNEPATTTNGQGSEIREDLSSFSSSG
jgi:hypothetical protein